MRDKDFKADIWDRTAAAWTALDPFLPKNDLCIESDTGKMKVGVGQRWSATPYLPAVDDANVVRSITTGITGASAITNIVTLDQDDYDAIAVPDPSTLYIITPAP